MNKAQEYAKAENLERWAFQWSQARLVFVAITLFLGGTPLVYKILPYGLSSLTFSLLNLAWIISGVASAYLLYTWHTGGHKVFGDRDHKDTAAFLISTISGLNLGYAGIIGTNLGMKISSGALIFILVGLLYLASAWHLQQRWKESKEKVF